MNNNYRIAKIVVPLPIDREFDYYVPSKFKNKIKFGSRVNVIFNKKTTVGYVVGLSNKSKIKRLNQILDVLDEFPVITRNNLALANRIKNYYFCSLGESINSMLPYKLKNLPNIINCPIPESDKKFKRKIIYVQNISQNYTLSYLSDEIEKRISIKKQIILLVPEIKIIPFFEKYFLQIDNIKIGIYHGGLSKSKMLEIWQRISLNEIDLIIGSRSSIFLPLSNLDLIVIYEENKISLKEDQVPYSNALEIALFRSEMERCSLMLCSTVPSLQVFSLISQKKIFRKAVPRIEFTQKAIVTNINFKDKIDLITDREISQSLENKEKVLIVLNRKGFATFLYCSNCKEVLRCNRCSSNLRFDYANKVLICPTCQQKIESTEVCPKCNCAYLKFSGMGIEKLESNLKRQFPIAKTVIFDKNANLGKIIEEGGIILSTGNIVFTGGFKPDITIIWDLDSMLNVNNFYACEDVYNLLASLLVMTKNKLIICSSLKDDFYLLKNLLNLDFKQFYKSELKIRKELNLPPYYHIGLISIRSLKQNIVNDIANRIFSYLKNIESKDFLVSNPYSSVRSRIRGKYYSYINIKARNVELLNNNLKRIIPKFRSNAIITVNIDPI